MPVAQTMYDDGVICDVNELLAITKDSTKQRRCVVSLVTYMFLSVSFRIPGACGVRRIPTKVRERIAFGIEHEVSTFRLRVAREQFTGFVDKQ